MLEDLDSKLCQFLPHFGCKLYKIILAECDYVNLAESWQIIL